MSVDLAADGGWREARVAGARLQYRVAAGHVDIASVRVARARRGRGCARRALEMLLAEADERGLVVRLAASPLDDRTDVDRLIRFYERLGFARTGERVNPLGHPVMERSPRRAESRRSG